MGRNARLACWLILGAASLAESASLEDLMRHPEFSEVVISPRGDYLAATVPQGDQAGVMILDIREQSNPKLTAGFRLDRHESATGLLWVSDERLVFTSSTQAGPLAQPRMTGYFYATDADGGRMRQLIGPTRETRYPIVSIIHLLPDDPDNLLISKRANLRERPIVWQMNVHLQHQVETQRRSRRSPLRLVTRSPLEQGGLAADHAGQVRFAYGVDKDGNQQFAWRPDEDAEWSAFNNPFGSSIEFWGFDLDGEHVYICSRDAATLGVYRLHLESGSYEPAISDDTFEPVTPIRDAQGESLIGAVFATPIPEARFFDPDHPTARIWRALQASLGANYFVSVSNFTRDQRLAVVEARSDREPGVFLLLDTERMQAAELVARKGWLDAGALAAKQTIRFAARDGLELHGYLTLPPGSDGERLPMVVEVHGGPYGSRVDWFYDPWVQAMALNGFAVLQINFRGSGGRGVRFERDAHGMWGAEMQDDITDGTRWAIEEGIADSDRICISGASYGGFAALSGLVREPELYRCGFAFAGVYDLESMKKEGEISSSEPGLRHLDWVLGTDAEVLRARSPISHAEKIRADVFVAHGAEDHQAHVGQYHALIERLEEAEIPHESLLVPREGHGFYEVENRVRLYGQALEFFNRNIGAGWVPDAAGIPEPSTGQ